MRLYKAAATEAARHVIEFGFSGIPRWAYAGGAWSDGETVEYVEFRDMAPGGLTLSRTAETHVEVTEGRVTVAVTGGPMLADDPGDFVLTIEVPDAVALEYEARMDPPDGWPFREFWLSPEVANTYRGTLQVFSSDDGEEVRPDLVGK